MVFVVENSIVFHEQDQIDFRKSGWDHHCDYVIRTPYSHRSLDPTSQTNNELSCY